MMSIPQLSDPLPGDLRELCPLLCEFSDAGVDYPTGRDPAGEF